MIFGRELEVRGLLGYFKKKEGKNKIIFKKIGKKLRKIDNFHKIVKILNFYRFFIIFKKKSKIYEIF
jgi:hypothetical protein